MTIFLLANTLSIVLALGYGWLAGDRLDRRAVGWIVAALLATLAANALASGERAVLAVLAIDCVLLAAITSIALRSPRYWPTWFAGLHSAGIICGLTSLVAAPPFTDTLRVTSGFWGVPALLAMVFGLFLDRRARALAVASR